MAQHDLANGKSMTPSRVLESAIRRFAQRRDAARGRAVARTDAMSAAAFRASVAERLRALERDVGEVRTRLNGLLFGVAGAVVTQVLLRLVG
jgi:hypothetical protein